MSRKELPRPGLLAAERAAGDGAAGWHPPSARSGVGQAGFAQRIFSGTGVLLATAARLPML